MRKVLLSMLAAAFLLSLVGPALALPILPATDPPSWWDNPDRQRNDTVTVTNTGGTGQSEGTLTVFLDNLNDRTKYKEVYLVVEWDTIDDVNESIDVDKVVTISWPGGPSAPGIPMILNVDDLAGPPYHWEYMFEIDPQPESEIVFFSYSGIEVAEQLVIEYDLRTKCFEHENGTIPEPSGLALLALGVVGLARRKRS